MTVHYVNLNRFDMLKEIGEKFPYMIYPDGGRGWGNRDRFLRKAEWQRIVLDRIKSFTCTGKRGERTAVGNE